MSKWKYAIGDLFREGESIIQIVGWGNCKGVYYCRIKPRYSFIYSNRIGSPKNGDRIEYRTEAELSKLEVVL